MYPLNMSLAAPDCGFACASNAAEHEALSAVGYLPAFAGAVASVAPADAAPVAEALDRVGMIAALESAGAKVDKRWSDARMAEELAKQ